MTKKGFNLVRDGLKDQPTNQPTTKRYSQIVSEIYTHFSVNFFHYW